MKQVTLAIAVLASGFIFAQEKISPIQINQTIYTQQTQTRASELNDLDSTYIYEFTTLNLTDVWDDFSTDKFEQFDAEPLDVGVTSVLYHRLMDETNTTPQDPNLIFCDSMYAHHDTVKIDDIGAEIEVVRHYPFTAYDVWINDLDFYPVEGVLKEGVFQECYVLIDSVIAGVLDEDQDTVWYNMDPIAYVQDSARVFTKVVTDPNTLWENNFACHNYTYAYNPWSLGVATFDGLDQNGYPYHIGDDGAHGVADYMTSRPIDLSVATGADIVYLTMIYQAKGLGNMPEAFDSLVLEMYIEDLGDWQYEWSVSGGAVEPDVWDTLYFPVPTGYYEDDFQFRFKNYASLSGALDHWHIDYVSLSIETEVEAGNFTDIAISYPVNTLLQDYTAVPWDHYKNTTGNEKMRNEFDLDVFNTHATDIAFGGGEVSVKNAGVLEGDFPIIGTGGPDAAQYVPGYNDCVIPMDPAYFYDQSLGGVQAEFDVKINITSPTDGANVHLENDTTYFTQRFDNYYAYDDGSAEAAYGIEGEGALMAYKFEAYEAGKLKGILMQFQPSVTDLSGEVFLLTVWEDNGGEPGEIIYQDDYFESHSPEYSGSKRGFRYYEFNNLDWDAINADDTSLTVDPVFYVGWQNISSASLNIGLDWNIDNGDKVFRNTSGEWLTSAYAMSLLIRPVFSTGLDYTLSIEDENDLQEEITLYPNPTSNDITLTGLSGDYELRIFDMSGRMVTSVQNQHQVNVSNLESGLYLVDVRDAAGNPIYSSKLIKK